MKKILEIRNIYFFIFKNKLFEILAFLSLFHRDGIYMTTYRGGSVCTAHEKFTNNAYK